MATTPGSTGAKPIAPPTTERPSLSGTVARLRKYKDNPKKVQEALVLIRKYFIKEKSGIDRLRSYGGIEALLEVIGGTNETCADIALSILGNACMDAKVQNQVLQCDGIQVLGKVIQNLSNVNMVNRACRALGNLAQNLSLCRAIHDEENILPEVVTHLNKTDDVNLQLTLIRTLRLLADTSSHRNAVVNEEGLRAVALYLKSSDEKVILAAYHAVTALSKEFNDVCARQIVAADAPAVVLEHTYHSNIEIKRTAFNIMMDSWMGHHEMRVGIGNAGGVPFVIEQISLLEDKRKRLIMANALCLSCCEVVNRVRVKDNGGLQIMLNMLNNPEYSYVYNTIISALTCFLYDESGWEILMKHGLVNTLISQLKRVANLDNLLKLEISKSGKGSEKEPAEGKQAVPSAISKRPEESETIPKDDVIDSDGAIIKTYTVDVIAPDQDAKPSCKSDGKSCDASALVESQISSSTSVDASGKDLQDMDDPDKNDKSNVTRYSVDSPTYKSVVDRNVDDYISGPKNILESEHYQCRSPDRFSGYSSPSNYGPYSPMSVSSVDLSPDTSPRSVSPIINSPEKRPLPSPEGSLQSSVGQSDSISATWSPTHSIYDDASSHFSVPGSPDSFLQPSSPIIFAGGSEDVFLVGSVHYSSSDDDDHDHDIKEFESSNNNEDLGVAAKEQQELLSLESLTAPSGFASGRAETSEGASAKVDYQRFNSDTSDTDASVDGSKSGQRYKRTPLSVKCGTKRKRDLTPEMRKRILLSVEKSKEVSSPSINLAQIMSTNVYTKKTEDLSKNELPSDKKDRRKQTEYCLIILIKKISCSADPTEHLVRTSVLGTLMDYVSCAVQPFSKCGRILIRLAKNPKCFETIVLEMVPQLVNDRLITRGMEFIKHKAIETHKEEPDKKTKSPEMNRSMSACTLKESQKAVRFHNQVKRKTRKSASAKQRKSTGTNLQETAELKEALFSNLAFMAETPFGQGAVEHLLLTGTENERMKTAVSLSLICRSRSLQTNMYLQNQGFRYIMMAIEQEDDTNLQQYAVSGLATMTSTVNSKQFSLSPKKVSSTSLPKGPSKENLNSAKSTNECDEEREHEVIFKMDDGTKISASRVKLSEQSDVFKAMLSGHYTEAGQAEISMPGVSKEAFQVIIDHLHQKPLGESYTLDAVLEAHGLADRFILDELIRNLSNLLGDTHMQMDSLQKIFAHAVLHESYWLMQRCIAFLLLSPLASDKERLEKFQELLRNPAGRVVYDVIEDMFHY